MKKYKVNISGAIIFHRLHDLHCNGIKSSPFALSLSLSLSLSAHDFFIAAQRNDDENEIQGTLHV